MASYTSQLAEIGSYLGEGGDIRLYGCDIGAGAAGQTLVDELARLTGADIAASDDLTGAAALDGDWDLEVTTGDVAQLQLPSELIQDYQGVLADPPITFDLDNYIYVTDNGTRRVTSVENDLTMAFESPNTLVVSTSAGDSMIQVFQANSAVTFTIQGGYTFDFVSLDVQAIQTDTITITPVGGSSSAHTFDVTDTSKMVTMSANLTGVTSVQITAQDGQFSSAWVDNFVVANVISPLNITLPSTPTTDEDNSVSINKISISDSDNDDQTVTLTATDGTFSFTDTSQLTLKSGSFTSSDVVFSGTLNNVNSALAGLSFVPTANFNGEGTLKVQTTDGTDTDTDTLKITVNSVNDAPVLDASPTLELTAIDEDPADPVAGTTTGSAQGDNLEAFTFRAWDRTSGTAGAYGDATTVGDSTAFSSLSDTVAVDVTSVNDAPSITDGSTHTLTNISEDDSSSTVATVSDILSGVNYSDADTGAQSGIAITATEGNGTWQYDPDNSGNWVDMPAVSTTNALLLSSTAKVRYVPDGENGEADVDLTFKAWDQTVGTASTSGSAQHIDTTTTGNVDAFSTGNASVRITVTSSNDSPVLDTSQSPALSAIDEDSAAPTAGSTAGASTVSSLLGGLSDVDTGTNLGMAITNTNTDDGTLWYSRDNGTSWQEITGASDSNALLLEGSILFVSPAVDVPEGS